MATGYKADAVITIGTSVDVGGINSGLKQVNSKIGKFTKIAKVGLAEVTAAFLKLSSSALSAASDLQEVQNVVDTAFRELDDLGNVVEDCSYKIENFSKTCLEKFGISRLAAKQTAGSFAAMGTSMGLTLDEATSMAVELTALTADFASFYNISQDYARVAMSAVYTGETETIKRYGIVLTEANLQEFANANGIEESVKLMGAREKLILRYQYIQSVTNQIDGDFVKTQNSWANQTSVLKQRWQEFLIVLGNGLITVLTPLLQALNTLLQLITKIATAIGSLVSRIFGIQFQNVVDQTGDYNSELSDLADSADEAADSEDALGDSVSDAAKEAEQALGVYDKLNVIQQPTDSSSEGTDSDTGLEDILSDLSFDTSLWDDAVSDLKDKIYDSFYDLGADINKLLKNGLNKIEWDYLYDIAEKIAYNLADGLNGFFSDPTLFYDIGKSIANALNTAIRFAFTVGDTLDFEQIGIAISNVINGFFKNFDFKLLAKTISTWAQGVFTMLKTAINNIKWSSAFDGLTDFLGNLDLTGYMLLLPTFITTLKTIGSTKIYTGFKNLTSIVKDMKSAFLGSKTASEKLQKSHKILFGIEESVYSVYEQFMFALKTTGSGTTAAVSAFKALKTSIMKFHTYLSKTQKTVGVLGTALLEISVTKSAFYDIASGADNLTTSIGKIVVAVGAATAAFTLLTGSFPIAALLTAVGAVTGAVIGITQAADEAAEAAVEAVVAPFNELNEEVSNTISELSDSLDELDAKYDQIKGGTTDDILELEALENAYFNLAEQETLTADQQLLLKQYGQELIEKVPELSGVIDDETGALQGTTQAVEELIDAKKREYQLEALKDLYIEAYKKQYEAQQAVTEAEQACEAALDALISKGEEYYNLTPWDDVDVYTREFNALQEAYNTAEQNLQDAEAELERVQSNVDSIWDSIAGTVETATTEASESVKEFKASVSTSITDMTTGTKKSLDDWKNDTSLKSAEIRKAFSDIADSASETADTTTTVTATASRYMAGKIDDTITETTQAINTGLSGIQDDMSTYGTNSGSDYAKNIATGMQDNASQVETAANDIGAVASKGISGIISSAWDWGSELAGNLAGGIRSMLDTVKGAASELADKIASFIHFSRPDMGALRDYEEWMPDFINGLADGIQTNSYILENEVSSLANKMQMSLTAGLDTSKLSNLSTYNVTKQLASGITTPTNKEFASLLNTISTPNKVTQTVTTQTTQADNQPIILQLDGKTVAKVVWSEEEKRYKQTGSYTPRYS